MQRSSRPIVSLSVKSPKWLVRLLLLLASEAWRWQRAMYGTSRMQRPMYSTYGTLHEWNNRGSISHRDRCPAEACRMGIHWGVHRRPFRGDDEAVLKESADDGFGEIIVV